MKKFLFLMANPSKRVPGNKDELENLFLNPKEKKLSQGDYSDLLALIIFASNHDIARAVGHEQALFQFLLLENDSKIITPTSRALVSLCRELRLDEKIPEERCRHLICDDKGIRSLTLREYGELVHEK